MRFLTVFFTASFILAAQQPSDDKRLVFATFHGGDRTDDAAGVAVDPAGNIYVTGESDSRDLNATPVGGKPLTFAVSKGYLTKYAPNGKEVLWRLHIGGSSNTVPRALALDADGNVYVTGSTGARDLPMVKPIQTQQPGLNILFIMKFSPKGELLFSTLYGGERNDEPRAITVDSQGNIYVAGRASSSNFPTRNAIQPKIGGSDDGFILKITPDLQLAYATYLGGAGSDHIQGLAVSPDDSVYVTGQTLSQSLSTPGAYIPLMQSYSSFAARISPAGDAIQYFTYVGWRGGYTVAQAITVDAAGRAWIGGHTTSKQLPTSGNAIQKAFAGGMRDGFLMRLNADGTSADYISYLGGSTSGPADPDEAIEALKIDGHGHVHAVGFTNSRDFPGHRAVQSDFGGAYEGFAIRLDAENQQLINASFWGGTKNDYARVVALGPGENVTVAGDTFSDNLPTARAVQPKIGSNNDAFVTQFCDPWPAWWSAIGFQGSLRYTIGNEPPAALELEVLTGCSQAFPASVAESSAPWLKVSAEKETAPMKLRVDFDTTGLPAGEHKAIIKVTVPDAFRPILEIPVTLTVLEMEK